MNDDVFYFGCGREPGHYLFSASGRQVWDLPSDFPCPMHTLDSGFLPPKLAENEGVIWVWRVRKWAVVAFWDRSVDTRGKCNSAFVLREQPDSPRSDDELLQAAFEAFPWVYARIKFRIVTPAGHDFLFQSPVPA